MHPRTLGRAWLGATATLPHPVREPARLAPPLPFEREPVLELVPTMEETLRLLGARVHHLSRRELAAWNAPDDETRDETRRAIREALRDAGGGELRDPRGRLIERVE